LTVDDQLAIGWDHIDAIGLQLRRILYLVDPHRRGIGEDLGKMAGIIGGEVDDHDIGQAKIGIDLREKGLERLDAAGRGADGAYRREAIHPRRLLVRPFHDRSDGWPADLDRRPSSVAAVQVPRRGNMARARLPACNDKLPRAVNPAISVPR
jgi:hypothetical protein